MANYTVLSNFGVRYFLCTLEEGAAASATKTSGTIKIATDNKLITAAQDLLAADEITDVLSCSVGEFSKDVKTFKTLAGDGWDSAVSLGQALSEGNISLIRTGTGDKFTGAAAGSTYNRLRAWMMDAAATGGSNAPKALVEVVPRGGTDYEATVYRCCPTSFDPGERNTSDGQEYSISVQPFGNPVPAASVSVSSATGTLFTISGPTRT